ncbi:Protein of unknown function [Gryllus bimaculatus]|nr:Protein of unknown function [Gryllus bimaculatus]
MYTLCSKPFAHGRRTAVHGGKVLVGARAESELTVVGLDGLPDFCLNINLSIYAVGHALICTCVDLFISYNITSNELENASVSPFCYQCHHFNNDSEIPKCVSIYCAAYLSVGNCLQDFAAAVMAGNTFQAHQLRISLLSMLRQLLALHEELLQLCAVDI